MSPSLALLLWLFALLMLLAFDPARVKGTSLALWVPVIWIFIIGSRLPSQWLGNRGGPIGQAFEEGNPIDRTISFILIFLAIGILMSRSFDWGEFIRRNFALIAFLLFGLCSVLWSDFQFIAFKRWFRDLGNYLVILVILSDPRPLEAVRTVLRRLCYLLIPLSVLLIKYFPEMAKHYELWSGAAEYVGAATSKNMLGAMCLVSALFYFWDTTTRWSERKEWRTKKIFVVNLALIAMTVWLLNLASSATSRVCLAIGCVVIFAIQSKWGKRHPTFLKISIPATFCLYLILAFGFGLNGALASEVGRDPTLTDRTLIWKTVLSQHTNPLVGTGYESFWLGPRLQSVWQMSGLTGITEAHNGYLEFYLDFGFIGLFFLGGLLIASYRTICRQLSISPSLASLNLSFWTIMLFYNMTEAAFKSHLMWITFLLTVITVTEPGADRVRSGAAVGQANARERVLRYPLEAEIPRR